MSSRAAQKKVLSTKGKAQLSKGKGKLPASKPLADESSDEDSDAERLNDLQDDEDSEEDSEEGDDDDEDDSDEEEEDDVTEEGLERLMRLLGDVDPKELGLVAAQGEDDEDEEIDSEEDDDDEDDEEDDEELEQDVAAEQELENAEISDEEVEALYEDLDESEAGDIVPVEKTTVNDKFALERVLATFKSNADFFDTLTLTNPKSSDIVDADNDLERELAFYKQALWAAQHAEKLHQEAEIPFTRPQDYFAEMVKTDAHMSNIRQKLLDESAGIKASEEARKLRDAKKFGKKVQVERLKERQKEKTEVGKRLESLKKKRKGGEGGFASTEDFDIALEDAIAGNANKKRKVVESERGGRGGKRGISRQGRDSKFGNPTSSRRPKENNDKTDFDAFGGRRGGGGRGRGGSSRGGARGGRGRGGSRGGSNRLGKSRRK